MTPLRRVADPPLSRYRNWGEVGSGAIGTTVVEVVEVVEVVTTDLVFGFKLF